MILAVLLTLGLGAQPQTQSPATAAAVSQEPAPTTADATTQPANHLERVHVLGASMSAGFGLMQEVGAPVTIADFLTLALGEGVGTMRAYGDTLFFQQPVGIGQKQLRKSQHSDPTLVIALDFSFWYGYGYLLDCAARLEQLEECLEQLESFDCPILLGDFPDMTPALLGSSPMRQGKPMLDPKQIPDKDCLQQLNARLHDWAAERANVHIYPLAFFVAEVTRERTFEFRGIKYDKAAKQEMLQSDLLHPTVKGTVAATLFLLHQMVEAELISAESIVWDAAALEAKVYDSTKAAREAAAERKRKRQERKAKREAEKAKREGDDKLLVTLPG